MDSTPPAGARDRSPSVCFPVARSPLGLSPLLRSPNDRLRAHARSPLGRTRSMRTAKVRTGAPAQSRFARFWRPTKVRTPQHRAPQVPSARFGRTQVPSPKVRLSPDFCTAALCPSAMRPPLLSFAGVCSAPPPHGLRVCTPHVPRRGGSVECARALACEHRIKPSPGSVINSDETLTKSSLLTTKPSDHWNHFGPPGCSSRPGARFRTAGGAAVRTP